MSPLILMATAGLGIALLLFLVLKKNSSRSWR